MKQIYQQAREVVVWLYQPTLATSGDSTTWNIVEKDNDRRLTELPLWFLRMFHHSWFMRVWVLQEVVYGRIISIIYQHDEKRTGRIP